MADVEDVAAEATCCPGIDRLEVRIFAAGDGVARTPGVVKVDSLAPHAPGPSSSGRRRARAASRRPPSARTPAGPLLRGAPPPRRLAGRPAAGGRHPRRLPRGAPRPGPPASDVDGGGYGVLPSPPRGRREAGGGTDGPGRRGAGRTAGGRDQGGRSARRISPRSSPPATGPVTSRPRQRVPEAVALERGRLDAMIAGGERAGLDGRRRGRQRQGATVRRGQTKQETRRGTCGFVKGGVARALRSLRAALSPVPDDRVCAALAEDGGASCSPGPGGARWSRTTRPG